ncbi:unnamed protein product [Brassicogethes aeneus]|uniref:Uncharacterized protein n=1 Tax=Brassicogethes aeneus TaxID=1431903 RepID=A0A9P0AS43_BRAAE|nr:unnamed protein product [Brassicogethes aeneus]
MVRWPQAVLQRNRTVFSNDLGNNWKLISGKKEGQTQVSCSQFDNKSKWCFPIDIHLATAGIQDTSRGVATAVSAVYGAPDWLRHAAHLFGYGVITVPTSPGTHLLDCYTWRPLGSLRQRFVQYFLGGGLQLKYPDIIISAGERYKLSTEAMGVVSFNLSVILRNFSFIIIANYVHVFGTTASNNITTTVTPVTEENVTTTLISTTTEIVTTTCSATSTCNENITTLPTTTTPKPKSQESKNKIKKQTHLETPKEGCSCNNQRTICDINCCCDSDCTIEDRQVFGYCKNEENIFYDTRYCDYIKYIYENNTQQKWHVNQNSLFCIASSNLPASYLIQKKQPLLTFEEALLQKTGRLSWVSQEWPPGGTVKKDLTVDFIYGSPTFIIRNNKIQKFDIDVSWFTDVCNNKEQILYLKNAKTTCSVLNVGDDNKKLNFITYFHNISILATPNAINKSKFYDEHFQINDLLKILKDKRFTEEPTRRRGKKLNVAPGKAIQNPKRKVSTSSSELELPNEDAADEEIGPTHSVSILENIGKTSKIDIFFQILLVQRVIVTDKIGLLKSQTLNRAFRTMELQKFFVYQAIHKLAAPTCPRLFKTTWSWALRRGCGESDYSLIFCRKFRKLKHCATCRRGKMLNVASRKAVKNLKRKISPSSSELDLSDMDAADEEIESESVEECELDGEDIYSQSSSHYNQNKHNKEVQRDSNAFENPENAVITTDTFVIVKLTNEKTTKNYVGCVREVVDPDTYMVHFLRKHDSSKMGDYYYYPQTKDESVIERRQLILVLRSGCPKNICLPITAKICDENFNVCVNILKPDKKLEISCQYDLVKNTNTCKNVVKKAKYNIYHNGTNGIKSVEVLMVLTLVKYEFSNADYEHYIDYEVNFLWVNQSKSFSAVLSGSPGYNTGKPILIGCSINFGNKSHPNFTISRDSLNYLKNFLVVPKNINGVCVLNNHVYNPIEFGYNLLTKCKYRGQTQKIKNEHPTNICRKIQRDILFNWLISEDENRSYGYFGDADSDKLSDWWPILLETSIKNTINNTIGNFINKNESLYCLNIISGLEIDIFHTRIDFKNLINQEKILGITFKFNKARNTSFSYENNSITHYFEMDLKSKVMFYDISIHKRKKFVDPPTFEVKLPYDFFYPFIRVYNNDVVSDYCCRYYRRCCQYVRPSGCPVPSSPESRASCRRPQKCRNDLDCLSPRMCCPSSVCGDTFEEREDFSKGVESPLEQ